MKMNIETKTNKEGLYYFVLYDGKKMVAETDLYFSQEFFNKYKDQREEIIISSGQYISDRPNYDFNKNDLLGVLAFFFSKKNEFLDLFMKYYYRDRDENKKIIDFSFTTLQGSEECDIIVGLCKEFFRVLGVLFNSLQFINENGYYNGLSKIKSLSNSYKECDSILMIDGLYFWNIEKIDNYESLQRSVLLAVKGFQDELTMSKYISSIFDKLFSEFVQRKGFDAIGVIPNNIQRKISLNQEIEIHLKKLFPDVKFIEIGIQNFPGRMPQKSTRGLCNRIENAENLLLVEDITDKSYKNILLIDDVFGSGATMNAVATKIKKQLPDAIVTGFAMLSSYRKGFDVLSEI